MRINSTRRRRPGVRVARPAIPMATAALLAALLEAGSAGAHSLAASAFDAVTEGSDLFVQFRLDSTSIRDLLNRGRAAADMLAKPAIDSQGPTIADYVDAHFLVTNDGARCPPHAERPAHFDARTDKVFVALLYRCPQPLGVLTLRTGLFQDDATPHQVLGTFRHKRAQENYLLSPALPEAIIDTAHLAQVGPAEATRPGQVHVATPPPGAFDGEAALPARHADPIGSGFWAFLAQGIRHILGGLDHVLFVVALVSVVGSWRELAKVVTSFTLAHSLTLALGALDLVRLSPRIVEPLIAASIVYVAVENVARSHPRARLGVTFGFGLVHGFGFSSVLRDLGLGKGNLLSALVGFNVGVEIGQLLIVAPLAPLVWWLQRRLGAYRRVRLVVNAMVALVAGFWLVQRIAGV